MALILTCAEVAHAQTSSIGRRHAAQAASTGAHADTRTAQAAQGNPVLEQHSLSAVKIKPPRKFRVHDLITIIIREQRKYESESDLDTKKQFDIQSKLNAIFKPIDGTLGAGTFSAGKPDVDYKFRTKTKNEAEKEREDRFTTRVTGEIIDIKPNGNLVIQASARTKFDDEVSIVTLTGVARHTDVNPDNTILSTQLADKVIDVHNEGAVRDGSRRGWIPRLLDLIRPF